MKNEWEGVKFLNILTQRNNINNPTHTRSSYKKRLYLRYFFVLASPKGACISYHFLHDNDDRLLIVTSYPKLLELVPVAGAPKTVGSPPKK